jgi:hypothetical protein
MAFSCSCLKPPIQLDLRGDGLSSDFPSVVRSLSWALTHIPVKKHAYDSIAGIAHNQVMLLQPCHNDPTTCLHAGPAPYFR